VPGGSKNCTNEWRISGAGVEQLGNRRAQGAWLHGLGQMAIVARAQGVEAIRFAGQRGECDRGHPAASIPATRYIRTASRSEAR
jgi:hypothetical protein